MKNLKLASFTEGLFKPKRYKVRYGGRGSGKSFGVADVLLIIAAQRPLRILCAREFQNSISESVHKLLCERISELGMSHLYNTTNNRIVGSNGSEFIFKGVRHNVDSIKSMQSIDILWLEEAQTVSQRSWEILIPTIRKPNSEIWVTYNPENEDDPTHVKFVDKNGQPLNRPDADIVKVNWYDNPWFPEVLRSEKDYMYEVNPELADHIWGGNCRTNSDAQIFKDKYEYKYFDVSPNWHGPYFGADFGFSQDPSTLSKVYIDPIEKYLYVRQCVFGVQVELDDMSHFYDEVEGSRRYEIQGDNSRPETISFLQRKGFSIKSVEKWDGSVEDGITFLRSFRKIIIHVDCPDLRNEFRYYSYKTDRLTGAITRDIVDAHNHGIDAIRYSLVDLIKLSVSILDVL